MSVAGGDSGPQVQVQAGSGDVTNGGTINAAQAKLDAAGGNVYALATNNGGLVRATGTTTRAGRVYLTAGGDVQVGGTIKASNADGSGGTVKATGNGNASNLTVNVSLGPRQRRGRPGGQRRRHPDLGSQHCLCTADALL